MELIIFITKTNLGRLPLKPLSISVHQLSLGGHLYIHHLEKIHCHCHSLHRHRSVCLYGHLLNLMVDHLCRHQSWAVPRTQHTLVQVAMMMITIMIMIMMIMAMQ